MTEAPELNTCPCCDSRLGPFVASPDGKRQVVCSTCGMRGPYETVHITAEQHFNRLPRADKVQLLIGALDRIAKHVPQFDYVKYDAHGVNAGAPCSPFDHGRQQEALRISIIAAAALAALADGESA